MKNYVCVFLTLVALVAPFAFRAQQSNPDPPPIICGIYFDYDAAGNRIKRYYDCKGQEIIPPGGGGTESSTGTGDGADTVAISYAREKPATVVGDAKDVCVQLAPNPTAGKFTIRLSESIRTHFHIYDIKGAIITSGFVEGAMYDGDISALVPGMYIVIVYFKDKPYAFRVVKS